MIRDLANNIAVRNAFTAAAVTATGNGAIVDTQGFDSATFVVAFSAVGAADTGNFLTFSVRESDSDTFGDSGTEITAPRILGTLPVINTTSLSPRKFGVVLGTRRYLRLTWTETGTANATFGVIAVLGTARHAPAS